MSSSEALAASSARARAEGYQIFAHGLSFGKWRWTVYVIMSRKIILTGDTERGKTVKSDVTVPSENRDIRLVAEAGQTQPLLLKRKPFKVNMAKETKRNQRARPARKIKLNRSIFNSGFEGKPSFHVKTLDEIKSEKKESKTTATVTTQAINNIVSTTKPNIEENNFSGDMRNVVKLVPAKKLMLPTIQLTRISSGNYSRSVTKSAVPGNVRGMIRSEKSLQRFKMLRASNDGETVRRGQVRSPAKKRKLSPIRSPGSESQVKYQVMDAGWSPRVTFTAQDQQTSTPLIPPASPPLSLGAQSDSDLDDEPELETVPGARMIINSTDNQKLNYNHSPSKTMVHHKFFQMASSNRLKSDSTTTRHSFVLPSGVGSTFDDDDKLDVMSIMADDDELFQDVKPRPMLKRSLSQDSVFDMAEGQDKSSDLRSLLTKTKDSGSVKKYSVGDHFNTNKRVSKSFKIPLVNQNSGKESVGNVVGSRKGPRFHRENSRSEGSPKGPRRRESGNFSSNPPKGKTSENYHSSSQSSSHDHPQKSKARSTGGHRSEGFSPQGQSGLLDGIKVNLGLGNVGDAWSWINKLDQTNCAIDVRILEETMSVCERVSRSTPTPILCEAVLGVFEIIKRQGNVKPTDFVMVSLTLGRCQRIQEAFSNYQAMKVLRKFPPEDTMERFISDFCKCLVVCPAKIVEVIQDIKWFPFHVQRKFAIVNSCVSFLISCQSNKLKEVNTGLWNSLLAMLCSPPMRNVQSACQVHNLMEQNGVALNPSTTLQLINLFQESKSIKPLLNLLCAKNTMNVLAMQKSPVDIGHILSGPTIDAQQLEACYAGLIKDGTMPTEAFLHHFIAKALLVKDYGLIYQFFLKCERSPLSLPVSTLKEMMEALENWDDNPDASVQVYATLRQTRKVLPKKPAPPPIVKREEPRNQSDRFVNGGFHRKPCFSFMQRGYCYRGGYCNFSHDVPNHQFPTRESDQSERESIDDGQNSKDSGATADMKPWFNSKATSPVDNPGHTVFNTALPNGLNHNLPNTGPPFPSFQVFRPAVPPRIFNPQVFNKMRGDRPPFTTPQFQRNGGNPIPRFHGPVNSHPRGPGIRPHGRPPLIALRPPIHPLLADSHFPVQQPFKPRPVRSFSWEPTSNVKSNLSDDKVVHQNPTNTNLDNDNNNNNASDKAFHDLQHHVETAVKSKEWQQVYAVYAECKGSSSEDLKNKDLQLFRNGFIKDTSAGLGQNFKAFVEFLYKENNSGKSCRSNQSVQDVFDQYDTQFIGAVGVSLMERCLVSKQFDDGYDVLLTLHSHNISYFQSGKNFGAYTKDIPAQNVALIAVKLCLGIAQHGLLGAMEVLRASNYACGEEGEILSPKEKEYRVKILHQLFTRLFEESHILEALEIVQNLNASPNVSSSMYGAILNHYVASDDFDQSFTVLAEMQEKGLELNVPPCHLLYEKFLKQCVEMQRYNRAMITLKEMESRAIELSGEVLRDILSCLSSGEQGSIVNLLLEKCIGLEVFPKTFSKDTPWLCELACGFSELELRLLIQKHLEQLHEHLLCTSRNNQLIADVQDLEIVLFPRLSGVKSGITFTDGIQSALVKDGVTVEGILHDLNPPLAIVEQSGEQFHKKVTVEKMSIYRWFSANIHDSRRAKEELLEEDEISSQESIGSDISDLSDLLA